MRNAIKLLVTAAITCPVLPFASPGPDIVQLFETGQHPRNSPLIHDGADAEESQGIAFGGHHWFFSNRYYIYRLSANFDNTDAVVDVRRNIGCQHAGGIDYYSGEVFVALDNCPTGAATVAVFDERLELKRIGYLPELEGKFPWVAINPSDDQYLYSIESNGTSLVGFPRMFSSEDSLIAQKEILFDEHPQDVLFDFRSQGGAFSKNGLFFRVVDDAHDTYSNHTGIWIYEITSANIAEKIGLRNIRYIPDQWFGNWRNFELEDIDATSIDEDSGVQTAGDIHIMMLNNDLYDDEITIYHFESGDYDEDGIRDVLDSCPRVFNVSQGDYDGDGRGIQCDPGDAAVLMSLL